jgi:hypothetical protein
VKDEDGESKLAITDIGRHVNAKAVEFVPGSNKSWRDELAATKRGVDRQAQHCANCGGFKKKLARRARRYKDYSVVRL